MICTLLTNTLIFATLVTSFQQDRTGSLLGNSYEVLKSDSAWCGPRVLYFVARLYDKETTLGDVVRLCSTDGDGYTTMAQLVAAALKLELESRAVEISFEDLCKLNKPAIICIRRTVVGGGTSNTASTSAKLHFISFIKCENGNVWVFDPSKDARAALVTVESLRSTYVNRAIVFNSGNALDIAMLSNGYTYNIIFGIGIILILILLSSRIQRLPRVEQ